MVQLFAALLPVFVLIALGFALRVIRFGTEDAWRLLDKLNYFVLFPALITATLARADLAALSLGSSALVSVLGVLTGAAALMLLKPVLTLSGPAFTSVFQGAIRWNGIVALAAASAAFGPPGIALVAVVFAAIVPLLNVLCVSVLARYGENGGGPSQRLSALLIRNPLIIACLIGSAISLSGITIPPLVSPVLDYLSDSALALGLIAVGAGLNLGALRSRLGVILAASAAKLIAMPLTVAAWATALGITGDQRAILIICGAVSTAASGYALARQLGGDAELMAGLITATTLGAMVTMPVVVAVLG